MEPCTQKHRIERLEEEVGALEKNRKYYEEFKVLEARVRVNKRILKREEADENKAKH